MSYPISVFTMDVSNSKKFNEPSMLTQYLDSLVHFINNSLHGHRNAVRVKHRFGDEILVIAEGYSAAYVIAFYIRLMWKYEKHLPYFGAVFGESDTPLVDVGDIDGWNHPLVWLSRESVERLKEQNASSRVWMIYTSPSEDDRELIDDINLYLEIQNDLFIHQSSKERIVGLTYTVTHYQEYVAQLLGKDPSTISRQVKSSRIELLLKIKDKTIRKLTAKEPEHVRPVSKSACESTLREAAISSPKWNHRRTDWETENWLDKIIRLYLYKNLGEFLSGQV